MKKLPPFHTRDRKEFSTLSNKIYDIFIVQFYYIPLYSRSLGFAIYHDYQSQFWMNFTQLRL